MEVDGHSVVLLDTPGFDDYRSEDVLQGMAEWLDTPYTEGFKFKLSGIVYMHDISDVQMSRSTTRSLRMLQRLVGDATLTNVVLVTNMWNSVDENIGEARERDLKGPTYWGRMIKLGSVVKRFDGTAADARRILASMLTTDRNLENPNRADR